MSEPKNPESSTILRAAHRLIGEDRTGLIAPDAPDRTVRFVAWVAVLSLFVLGWGSGTVRAVQVALGQDLLSLDADPHDVAAWIAATALAENSVTTAGAHDR